MTAVAATSDREERIRSILDDLIEQRRRMESVATEQGLIQANRLAISYWRSQLSRCGIEERPARETAAARRAPATI